MDPFKSRTYNKFVKVSKRTGYSQGTRQWADYPWPGEKPRQEPPMAIMDEKWKVEGNKIIPARPVIYQRGVSPFGYAFTVQGTEQEATASWQFHVPELAQVWLGAPTILRVTVHASSPDGFLDVNNPTTANADFDQILRNPQLLPNSNIMTSPWYHEFVFYVAGQLKKLSDLPKVTISIHSYFTKPIIAAENRFAFYEFSLDANAVTNYMVDQSAFFTTHSYNQYTFLQDAQETVERMRRRYRAEKLGYVFLD